MSTYIIAEKVAARAMLLRSPMALLESLNSKRSALKQQEQAEDEKLEL
jgi:hypothetical protein